MCLTQKGKVLEIKGNKVLVLVDGKEKEVRVEGKIKKGEIINIFQNLGFK